MRLCSLLLLLAGLAIAQSQPGRLRPLLERELIAPDVVTYQLQHYLREKARPLAPAPDKGAWQAEMARVRRQLLDEVVFKGWPREWIEAAPRFEDRGIAYEGAGYRVRKLRYEIVPGFAGTALLYEPARSAAKAPGIVNVNGHVGAPGKAVEYKQKRCINQALQGIYSLNLEWFSYGELNVPGNSHWYGAHLDLAGARGVGLFYLAMRKGLDYLEQHPNVDAARLGVTGLSGGGWQTIVLSALDERVAVSVPVAGYSDVIARLERTGDIGDIEQNPTDMLRYADYSHLTAMRAPKPTLLIYNAEDDCCFRAPLVRRGIFDLVRPLFRAFGAEDRLAWHENADPGDHNYQLENREQSYAFFTRHFGLTVAEKEKPVDGDVRSPEELAAGLPEGNLTILELAKRMAEKNRAARGKEALRDVVRFQNAPVRHAWALWSTKSRGVESESYRFDFANGLSATGVWFRALPASAAGTATILLNDDGRKPMGEPASERINRGEQVLAANLLLFGDAVPKQVRPAQLAQMIAFAGERPLGLQAAQLVALARWLRESKSAARVRIEASGPRSQAIAQVAAALRPESFVEVVVRNGLRSLSEVFDKPVEFLDAPELFCANLYRHFDVR